MAELDLFEGLGKALARLRERAGFPSQSRAAEALKIDQGQLSRWENENPRPTLENVGRLLVGYGATLSDLEEAMGQTASEIEDLGPTDEELIEALAAAIRRVEGRQNEMESRVAQDIEQLKKDMLGRAEG